MGFWYENQFPEVSLQYSEISLIIIWPEGLGSKFNFGPPQSFQVFRQNTFPVHFRPLRGTLGHPTIKAMLEPTSQGTFWAIKTKSQSPFMAARLFRTCMNLFSSPQSLPKSGSLRGDLQAKLWWRRSLNIAPIPQEINFYTKISLFRGEVDAVNANDPP